MDLATAIEAWRPFFTASAGAAAVLLGLVFVAMSIHYDVRQFDRHFVGMVTESAVPFFYATVVSLVMLMPAASPWVPTGGLVVVGILASFNSGVPLFAQWFRGGSAGAPRRPDRSVTFLLPWFTTIALVPAALWLLGDPQPALYLVAALVLLLLAFGMQNAWDALLRRDLREAVQRGRDTEPVDRSDGGASS